MELGSCRGEYVVLPDPEPPHLPIRCELHVYTYLRRFPSAREDLFARVKEARFTTWSQVFVHHRHLLFPILLNHNTTDEEFLEVLNERITIFFQRLRYLAQDTPRAPPPPSSSNVLTWSPDTSSAKLLSL